MLVQTWQGLILNTCASISLRVKFSADNILNHFSYSSQKTGLTFQIHTNCLQWISMKCQILFSGNKMPMGHDLLT